MTVQYVQRGRPLPGRHGLPDVPPPANPPPPRRWLVETRGAVQLPRMGIDPDVWEIVARRLGDVR